MSSIKYSVAIYVQFPIPVTKYTFGKIKIVIKSWQISNGIIQTNDVDRCRKKAEMEISGFINRQIFKLFQSFLKGINQTDHG